MENNSVRVEEGTWKQISNNEDYMLQNNGNGLVLVKASGTETAPTDEGASFKLPSGGVITSAMLPGIIWVTAAKDSSLVTYAK